MIWVIFLLGFIFRFSVFISKKSLWGDEWFSIHLAQQPWKDVFWGSIRDVHPPLYFLMLHGVVRSFGSEEWVFRFISFVASLGTLVAVYWLAKEFFSKPVATTTAFLVAISPYWLQSSNEIRSYSLFAFVTCLATLFLVKAMRHPSQKRWAIGYAVLSLMAFYIEHYAWFWFLGVTASGVWARWVGKKWLGNLSRLHGLVFLLALPSLALISYQAFYTEHVFDTSRLGEYLLVPILFKKAVGIFWHFTAGYSFSMLTVEMIVRHLKTSVFFWLSASLTVSSFGIICRGIVECFKKDRGIFIFFCTVVFFPVAALLVLYAIRLDARYLSFAAAPYFILLAYGLVAMSNRFLSAAFLVLFSFVCVTGSIQAVVSPVDLIHREDYRGMAAYVLNHASKDDAVCGSDPQFGYYRKKLRMDFRGDYFSSLWEFREKTGGSYRKVWLLGGLNMHPEVSDRADKEKFDLMARLGYVLVERPIRFGGEEGHTVLYVFAKSAARLSSLNGEIQLGGRSV